MAPQAAGPLPLARALSGPSVGSRKSVIVNTAPSWRAETDVMFASHRACLHCRVKKRNTFFLSMRFMDREMETRYSVEKEKQSGAAFSCSCVVLLCTALVEILIDPW